MNDLISLINRVLKKNTLIFALILVTFLLYYPTISFEFLNFDDDRFVTENKVVASDDFSFADCFQYKFKEHDYFPLTYSFFRLLRLIFGFNPVVFHAVNLMLHIANVLLVFFLGMKIFEKLRPDNKNNLWISGVIALLFSVHPLHVESIVWVIDLKDILFTFFYLGGMLAYWHWVENQRLSAYYLAFIFALFSILSKSTAITFIAILFLIDFIHRKKLNVEMLIPKIPFFLLTLTGFYIFGIFTDPSATLSGFTGLTNMELTPWYPASVSGMPAFFQRVIIASFRLLYWIYHFIFPIELNLFYTRKVLLEQCAGWLPFIPLFVMAIIAATWFLRRKMPLFFVGMLFFIITLSPSFAKSDTGISIFVPDRYMYLPLFGLLLVLISILLVVKRKWAFITLFMFFCFWCYQSVTYLPHWKNNYTLYDYCLSVDPDNPIPRMNRAMSYLKDGRGTEAFNDFDYYIKNFPHEQNEFAYLNRGVLLLGKGDTLGAINDFDTLLAMNSSGFLALMNRGNIYLDKNDLEKARADFSKAYDIDSTHFLLNKKIASLYNKAGNHDVALQFANKCLESDSADVDLLRVKGVSLFYLRRFKESIHATSFAIEKDSSDWKMWYFRSMARFHEKDYQGAKNDYFNALNRNAQPDEKFEKAVADSLNVDN